jgi:hypothetical protein
MKISIKKHLFTLVFSLVPSLLTLTVSANPGYLPKPPHFNTKTDPENILKTYPLGIIKMQPALAHHGLPDKKIRLPNGMDGWVYTVGFVKTHKRYRLPSGETKDVMETDWGLGVRNFVLVFSDKERVVIDVVYKDDGNGIGVTAMELQYPRPARSVP